MNRERKQTGTVYHGFGQGRQLAWRCCHDYSGIEGIKTVPARLKAFPPCQAVGFSPVRERSCRGRDHPLPDEYKGIPGKLRLAGTLKKRNFCMAMLFQNAFDAALLAFLAGIPNALGTAGTPEASFLPILLPSTPMQRGFTISITISILSRRPALRQSRRCRGSLLAWRKG